MRPKRLPCCLIAGALLGLPEVARAQVRGGFEWGFYGAAFPGRGAGGTRVVDRRRAREVRSEITGGTSFGVRAAYDVGAYFGIELAAGGSTNDHIVQLFDLGREEAREHTNALFFAFGNGVVHLLKGRFTPYVTAGLGGIGFVDQRSLAVNYGGGVKVFLFKGAALRIDARVVRTDLKGSIGEAPLTRPEAFTDKLRFTEVSVGFSFVMTH